jgi:SAM-dependent methyltransferase
MNRILDVGCGMGFFLDEAHKRNWEVHGTEYTDEAIEMCKGKNINMHKGDLDGINFADMEFDVITSFEVIEHVKNPQEHVIKMTSLLRKGGIIYITTPNFNSLNSRILKDKWNVISYPEHLNYFSKLSLDALMTSNGFKRLSLRTEGISPGRLFKSRQGEKMDFSNEENIDERLRSSIEGNSLLRGLKSIANGMMSISGLGESLKALYLKL